MASIDKVMTVLLLLQSGFLKPSAMAMCQSVYTSHRAVQMHQNAQGIQTHLSTDPAIRNSLAHRLAQWLPTHTSVCASGFDLIYRAKYLQSREGEGVQGSEFNAVDLGIQEI